MLITSIHTRTINTSVEKAAVVIDTFADTEAILWPNKFWPREPFSETLQIGSIGAHGGTRYRIERYLPGEKLVFRFIEPKSYIGIHSFEVISLNDDSFLLKHFTQITMTGIDLVIWQFAIRWVHDALIEDAFDQAEFYLTSKLVTPNRWLGRVYFFRYYLGIARLIKNAFRKFFGIGS